MAEEMLRLRFKGQPSGPHSRAEVMARLASGEFSLAHCVEQGGRWVTLRAYLRERVEAGLPSPLLPAGMPPPPPGAVADLSLERLTQRAYLWCGLTFGLPFLTVGALWAGYRLARGGFPQGSLFAALLLLILAVAGAAGSRIMARRQADLLEAEGLGDVARSARQLADGLSLASALLWTIVAATLA
jgi:hypothetical protein